MSRRRGGRYVIDEQFVKSQLSPFEEALKMGVGKRLTFNSGRFSAKAYSRMSSQGIFTRKEVVPEGKPKMALLVDCSGSMSGAPIRGAAHMCEILSRLHSVGLLEARIFCSGSSGNRNGFEVPMPQPTCVWERLMAPHGSEYLSQTFKKFRARITECDLVACYTDADICDHKLTPKLWRQHGKTCVGLYVGPVIQADVMAKFFDYSIARETTANLFHEYLRLVKRLTN